MYKLKILIVLYNKLPLESETLVSFLTFKEQLSNYAKLIIWDNSKKYWNDNQVEKMKEALAPLQFKYVANGLNTSLSKLYNKVIQTINHDEFLVIFDHDSSINISYFEKLQQSIKKNQDINLFVPIVIYDNQIVSPATLWHFKGSYWKNEKYGKISSKGVTAINSGMAIRGSYLASEFIGYDEDLKFYGTDDDFMWKYSKDNSHFYVLNTRIDHVLNFFENTSLNDKIFRFNASKEGCLLQLKKRSKLIYLMGVVYYLLLTLKYTVRYRSVHFIKKR